MSSTKPKLETAFAFDGYNPAVCLLAAVITGIVVDRMIDLPIVVYGALAAMFLAGWCLLFRAQGSTRVSALLLLLAFSSIAAVWHHGRWNWVSPDDISRFAGDVPAPVCLRAIVDSEPRMLAAGLDKDPLNAMVQGERTKYSVRVTQIKNGHSWDRCAGTTDLVIHAAAKHVSPGDEVVVFGSLVRVAAPTNPGQFDFQSAMRKKLKLVRLNAHFPESVIVQTTASKNWLTSMQSNLRSRLNNVIWRHVSPENAGLASAILLGNRGQLTFERKDQFFHTGTVHLLAISGLHVGILASVFFLLFQIGLVRRRVALVSVIAFVLFYAWLVEFRPPVCRAAILLSLYCLGKLGGQGGFSFNLLAVAGLIVLVINPGDVFGLGPQLSFMAVATMITFRDLIVRRPPMDPLQALIYKTRPWPARLWRSVMDRCRQAILVSALIWLVSTPLVAYYFHLVAPAAPIVNPILLIPLTFAIYGGLGVVIFGGWCSPVADWSGSVCDWNLIWLESVVERAESMMASHWWTAGPAPESLLLFYVVFLAITVFLINRVRRRWVTCFGLVWVLFGWIVPFQVEQWLERQGSKQLQCTFVDVGHGTSVLVQMPDGKSLLYDAGSLGSSHFAAQNIAGVLWSENIEHLDAVVVSHADIDHFNALPELCERFSVGRVYVSDVMRASQADGVIELFERLAALGVSVETLSKGDHLVCGDDVNALAMSPPSIGTGSTDNSDSIVLVLEAFDRRLLLPGDLELNGMQLLLSQPEMKCDVVMSPHHGSRNSRQAEFHSWSGARNTVISSSRKKLNPDVVRELESLGSNVCETGKLGAIRFVLSENKVQAMHWQNGDWRNLAR